MKIKLYFLIAIIIIILWGCKGNHDETKILKVNSIIDKNKIVMFLAFTHSETSATDKVDQINFYYKKLQTMKLKKVSETKANSILSNYEFGLSDTTVAIIDKDDYIFLIQISSNNEVILIDQRVEENPNIYKIEIDDKTEEFIESINEFLKGNK